jgi:peptidoglycan/xylan/chitin deacetylase (PgdA/CDA1 family)
MVRANEAIKRLTGRYAVGYRSPAWDLSANTVDLLIKYGFEYDSSMMGADYMPYRARQGDVVELGKPVQFGPESSLIEMPISWTLDDHPHFEYWRLPDTVNPGLQSPQTVMAGWLDEFRYFKKSVEWGVLTYTLHPYVIGRGYRMLAFEGFIDSLIKEGAEFMTMEQALQETKKRL